MHFSMRKIGTAETLKIGVKNKSLLYNTDMENIVPLEYCEYRKEQKQLKLASEFFGMPSEFFVHSHHTDRKIKFAVVKEGDPLFDYDHWDGEMCVYRPTEPLKNVESLVIYHQY